MIIDQYKKMKNLFLRQSYIDAWEDYQRSIRKRSFAQWDYIVLTASNDEQANAFQSQITYRQNKNVLPCKTKYLVLPDPDGKRVGSGGATLQVLRKLAEHNIINLRLDITHLYYPAKNSFQKGRLKRREIFTELLLYTLTT